MSVIKVGTKAPAFTLAASDGEPRSLHDLTADAPALLVFFKTTCPTCRMAMPVYGELVRRYGDATYVVAVSQDPLLKARAWLAEQGFEGLALDDTPDRYAVSRAFGVATVPTAVLVDADGKVVDVVEGWHRDGANRLAARLGAVTRRSEDPVSTPADGRPPLKPG